MIPKSSKWFVLVHYADAVHIMSHWRSLEDAMTAMYVYRSYGDEMPGRYTVRRNRP